MAAAFAGRTALVTGGGSGIGLACARRLAADGALVTLAGRTRAKVEEAAASLGADAVGVACDVGDEASVQAAVAAAGRGSGGLDLCVVNAGTGSFGPIVATPLEQWDDVLRTNLTGSFLTLKHAAAAMASSGGGSIVAISSIASPLTHRYMAAYCASKAGLDALVRTAADELATAGIHVNSVQPSLVPTELASFLDGTPEVKADYLENIPAGRVGTVEDIADAVAFLLGPSSTWITGQTLPVDGGHTLRRGPDLTTVATALGPTATTGVPVERP